MFSLIYLTVRAAVFINVQFDFFNSALGSVYELSGEYCLQSWDSIYESNDIPALGNNLPTPPPSPPLDPPPVSSPASDYRGIMWQAKNANRLYTSVNSHHQLGVKYSIIVIAEKFK